MLGLRTDGEVRGGAGRTVEGRDLRGGDDRCGGSVRGCWSEAGRRRAERNGREGCSEREGGGRGRQWRYTRTEGADLSCDALEATASRDEALALVDEGRLPRPARTSAPIRHHDEGRDALEFAHFPLHAFAMRLSDRLSAGYARRVDARLERVLEHAQPLLPGLNLVDRDEVRLDRLWSDRRRRLLRLLLERGRRLVRLRRRRRRARLLIRMVERCGGREGRESSIRRCRRRSERVGSCWGWSVLLLSRSRWLLMLLSPFAPPSLRSSQSCRSRWCRDHHEYIKLRLADDTLLHEAVQRLVRSVLAGRRRRWRRTERARVVALALVSPVTSA